MIHMYSICLCVCVSPVLGYQTSPFCCDVMIHPTEKTERLNHHKSYATVTVTPKDLQVSPLLTAKNEELGSRKTYRVHQIRFDLVTSCDIIIHTPGLQGGPADPNGTGVTLNMLTPGVPVMDRLTASLEEHFKCRQDRKGRIEWPIILLESYS